MWMSVLQKLAPVGDSDFILKLLEVKFGFNTTTWVATFGFVVHTIPHISHLLKIRRPTSNTGLISFVCCALFYVKFRFNTSCLFFCIYFFIVLFPSPQVTLSPTSSCAKRVFSRPTRTCFCAWRRPRSCPSTSWFSWFAWCLPCKPFTEDSGN